MASVRLVHGIAIALTGMCAVVAVKLFRPELLEFRAASVPQDAHVLDARTLNAPTRLNADDRERQVKRCISNAARIAADSDIKRAYFGNADDVERNIREGTRANCECIVGSLEDRTTNLQFEQAMQTGFGFPTGFSTSIYSHGKPERITLLYDTVARHGVSQRDFSVAAHETVQIIQSIGRRCMK